MDKKLYNPFDIISEFIIKKWESVVTGRSKFSEKYNQDGKKDTDDEKKIKILSIAIQTITLLSVVFFWIMLIIFFGLQMAFVYIGILVFLVIMFLIGLLTFIVEAIHLLVGFISEILIYFLILLYVFYLLAISSKRKYKPGMYISLIIIVIVLFLEILISIGAIIEKRNDIKKPIPDPHI